MMSKKLRLTQVIEIKDISPHMKRIVLSGDDLKDFPVDFETAHVKVLVLQPEEKMFSLTLNLGAKKRMRSYTVRKFDAFNHRLTIDFAVNDHEGLIANWAVNAQIGDRVAIGGPGPIKYKDLNADWHLLAGDLTALPLVAATIEKLQPEATGYAFLQIPSEADKQSIHAPENFHIEWIVNDDLSHNALKEHVTGIRWPDGTPHILIAGESAQITEINSLLKKFPQYDKNKTYASGYWKN